MSSQMLVLHTGHKYRLDDGVSFEIVQLEKGYCTQARKHIDNREFYADAVGQTHFESLTAALLKLGQVMK